jgi:hypothetical protein
MSHIATVSVLVFCAPGLTSSAAPMADNSVGAQVDGYDPALTTETDPTEVRRVHRARIRTLDELDDTVRQWIDRAYRVGCREHLH